MSLKDIRYIGGKMQYRARHATEPEWALEDYLTEARQIFETAGQRLSTAEAEDPVLSDDFHQLRWFPLPGEALEELRRWPAHGCWLTTCRRWRSTARYRRRLVRTGSVIFDG